MSEKSNIGSDLFGCLGLLLFGGLALVGVAYFVLGLNVLQLLGGK